MTTERIDVLAVMGRAYSGLATDGELKRARAAVSELIEAVKDLRSTKPTYSIAYGQAEQRVDNALARVGGA